MPTTTERSAHVSGRLSILDEDTALAEALSHDDREVARQKLIAREVIVEPGSYVPDEMFAGHDMGGMLVVDGLLIRHVVVADRLCGELVAAGSILRPRDHFGLNAPVPFEVRWRVLQTTRLAVLDREVLGVAGQWPPLMEALIDRAITRAQTVAFNVAIHCLHHVEVRLVVLLWHLADRFGRVTSEGVVIPLPLTHRDLAELVGAQRPSVSTALGDLARQGSVVRRGDRSWLLRGGPPRDLRDMRSARARNGGG